MDGADSSTSETNRTALPSADARAYSDRYVPTIRPIGVPMAVPSAVWIRLPTIALSRPPPEPGGLVTVVNTVRSRPATPRQSRVARIEARKASAMTVAAMQSVRTTRSVRRRRRDSSPATRMSRAGPSEVAAAPIIAVLGRSSRREIASTMKEITNRMKPSASSEESFRLPGLAFREFQRDDRGDRVARAEQRRRDPVGVADHEGHRHGLAERAAEAEHDPAHDRRAGVGDDDAAHHLPGGAADAVGGFLVHRRHGQEHVAHGRGDEGDDHDREHDRRGQDAGAERRALEQHADQRHVAERVGQHRLHVLGHERHDDEEAPHAVDDRRHRRQQLDRGADRPAQPVRRHLGQVERNPEGQRHRHDQGDDGGDDGAEHRHPGAEDVLHRIPVGIDQEEEAEGAEARQPADEQRDDDGAEQHQHEQPGGKRETPEDAVAHRGGVRATARGGRGGGRGGGNG